jgi:polar amino acid transport system substrate-binding protein
MKRLVLVTLTLLLLGCQSKNTITIRDQPERTSPGEATTTSETGPRDELTTVNIGSDDELLIIWNMIGKPGQFPDQHGNPVGLQPDVVRAIMERMGQNYRWVREDNYDLLFLKLKVGEVHVCTPTVITPERLRVYKFADVQDTIDFHFWVHEDNTDIGGDTPEQVIQSLFGKKLGVIHGNNVYESLRQYTEIHFVFYEQNLDLWPDLANKKIDAIQAVDNVAYGQKQEHGYPIKPAGALVNALPYAAAFYSGVDDEFIDRYNEALRAIKEDGTYDALKEKWFGQSYR